MPRRGLGLVQHAGRTMVWGKGVVAGDFVFLSGAEARSDEEDIPVEGIKAQTELALERIKARLTEAGASLENVVKFVWYLTDRSLESEFYEACGGGSRRSRGRAPAVAPDVPSQLDLGRARSPRGAQAPRQARGGPRRAPCRRERAPGRVSR